MSYAALSVEPLYDDASTVSPLKTLPSKYYLQHFHEFLDYVQGPCAHLLSHHDKDFIEQFLGFAEDTRCTYVRTLNRKSPFIKRQSLDYEEISDYHLHIEQLIDVEFLLTPSAAHSQLLIESMTKPELSQMLTQSGLSVRSSAPKTQLLELALKHLDMDCVHQYDVPQQYVVRGKQQYIDYFLFLFFGNLNSSLNKFSMRDMGIMRTQSDVSNDSARFDFIDEAKSAFFYAQSRRQLKYSATQSAQPLLENLADFPQAQGPLAQRYKDETFLLLGKQLLSEGHPEAVQILSQSQCAEAQEKTIRYWYKAGEKEQVKEALEKIIDAPESEALLTFAEDFLARKFQQKRTSMLTDMVRDEGPELNIDEIYLNNVERGVKHHYQQQGQRAFFTENRLWRALFGLVFWHELFELDAEALTTEFDRKPKAILNNCFYRDYSTAIDQRLQALTDNQQGFAQICQVITRHYGKSNGIFRWHTSLMEVFKVFFEQVELKAMINHLRAMAQDYRQFCDGYPDLMVVDDNGLRFEEVKAPGDQLRKNQLLTIRQLRRAGFNVQITQVQWYLDPNQPYVVVDIETTGGRAAQHRITEIGMVKMINGKIVDTWQSLINPQRHIPAQITRLTGISNEMVSDAPLFAEIAEPIRQFMEGAVFVAHNVNFDYSFIRQEFARLEQPFSMPKLCTVREMRKAVPGLSSYSLANLTEHFGIEMTRHHRALSDAQAAADLLQIINEHRHAQQ